MMPNTPKMISNLQRLIRQPSISATGEGIEECAHLTAKLLDENGIQTEILTVPDHAPLVYGFLPGRSDKTVLFYNHYDVQPAEPLELWEHAPFAGEVDDDRIYGRGAADDKGELVARIEAVHALCQNDGLPCNVKFVIEGEEESGSSGIAPYLDKFGSTMSCDGIVWEFGYVDEQERPIVGLGVKGLMFVDMTSRGPARDLHSGTAPIIQNPAWRLVGALSTLASNDGRISIPDWYAEAQPLSEDEKKIINEMPYDTGMVKTRLGVERFVRDQDVLQAKEDLVTMATCNIASIKSGYLGNGAKTVLPASASAKLDMRLIPGMDPQVQWQRFQNHLEHNGYGDIEAKLLHAEPGIRTLPQSPFVQAVRDSADVVYGKHVLAVTYPETGPMWYLSTKLRAPSVLIGGTDVHSPIHASDEYMRISHLEKTTKIMMQLLTRFSG